MNPALQLITALLPAPLAALHAADTLDRLNPAGGILDDGDGTGRHANKDKKKKSNDEPARPEKKPEPKARENTSR